MAQEFLLVSPEDMECLIKKAVKDALNEYEEIRELNSEKKDKMLSRTEAMAYLDVKKSKLSEMVKSGQLHPVRDKGGKFLRFWQSDLDRYQESLSPVNHD